MSKAITVLLDRLVAAELRLANVSRERAVAIAELHELQESHDEIDERNTDLHIQLADTQAKLATVRISEEVEVLRARIAELSVGKHVEVVYEGILGPHTLQVLSINSSNGETVIRVKDPLR